MMINNAQKYYVGLDMLRIFAVVCILISSINVFLPEAISVPIPNGIEFFLVLSGFFLGIKLFRLVDSKIFSWRDGFSVLKERSVRILPMYYFFLLLGVVLAYFNLNGNKLEDIEWFFLFFLQSVYEPFTGFFWESWSFSVSEWFYISFVLCFSLCFPILYRVMPKKEIILFLLVAWFVFPLLYKYSVLSSHQVDYFWWESRYRKLFLMRMDALSYGVLMAYLVYYYHHIINRWRYFLLLLGVGGIYTIMLVPFDVNGFYAKMGYFIGTGISISFVIPFFVSVQVSPKWVPLVRYIGKLSFALYMVHLSVVAQVLAYQNWHLPSFLLVILYIGGTFLLAFCVHEFFEKPITLFLQKRSVSVLNR